MKRRLIVIEVNDDGTVGTQVPAREFTDSDCAEEGVWTPREEHASLDDALEAARVHLARPDQG